MRLIIEADGVELGDAADFGSFAAVTDLASDRLGAVVLDLHLGRLDPDGRHLWVDPRVLEAAAGADRSPAWDEGFAALRQYAAAHGWTDDESRIRAHLVAAAPEAGERPGAPPAP